MKLRGRGYGTCRPSRNVQGIFFFILFGAFFIMIHIAMKSSYWMSGPIIPTNLNRPTNRITSEDIDEAIGAKNPTWDSEAIKEEDDDEDLFNVFVGDADYVGFLENVDKKDLKDKFFNRHQYEFTLNNKMCDGNNVFLLNLLHSAPGNYEKRMQIRYTWGSVGRHMGANIMTVFLIAQVDDEAVQNTLVGESLYYNDLIQGNFVDSYKNLTYKHMMGLHWARNFCNQTKFVLKADDDLLVDMYHLISFLMQTSPDGDINNFMYCSVYRNQGPIRDKRDKWYVDMDMYPYQKYPSYCEGFAYVISMDVVSKFYRASKYVKFYWVDDVLVTGFLALKSGVLHKKLEPEHSYTLMSDGELKLKLKNVMFILDKYQVGNNSWNSVWNEVKLLHDMHDK